MVSEEQKREIDNVSAELNRLKDYVAAIGFGIDYKEYVEIQLLLPEVRRQYRDETIQPNKLSVIPLREYSEEEARRILTFVEKQALEFQA